MGVLNVTPDSFFDGGKYLDIDSAIKQAQLMVAQGADIIDIGGESTRPGAETITIDEELERTIPVIEALFEQVRIPISIDTSKPEVMQQAVFAGASLINDVNALQADGGLEMAARLDCDVCLMHRRGNTKTMQNKPIYNDVVEEIGRFFTQRLEVCSNFGIKRDKIILDPGFGFGKTLIHNLEILKRLGEFKNFGLPLLVGISRKSMIGALLNDRDVDDRLIGSTVATIMAVQKGANIVRVHDVLAIKDALTILQSVEEERA